MFSNNNITKLRSTQLVFLFVVLALMVSCHGQKKTLTISDSEANALLLKPDLDKIPMDQMSPTDLSSLLVKRVMNDKNTEEILKKLKEINNDSLQAYLNTDAKKECFWINIYNGHCLKTLKKDPSLYLEDRSSYFDKEQIYIGDLELSLEDIEHGILRKGATIWTTGYLRLPFRNKLVRKYAVKDVDFKIHFALNCGAKSCPPIAVYYEDLVEQQLSRATQKFLEKTVIIDEEKKEVSVPAFMNWFRADFGGKNGINSILYNSEIIPDNSGAKIVFSEYDWTMDTNNVTVY